MKLRNRWSILRKIHSFGYSMLLLKMEVHDYQAAQIYLDNAESFRKKHVTDSWQIDTIKEDFC